MHVAPTRPQPRTRLSGPQLAGWTPAGRSEERYAIHLDRDVAIALADGTVLRADVYRPASAGAFPALLSWSSYTRELQVTGAPAPFNEVGATELFVRLGYAHVIASARGSARSGGAHQAFFSRQEQADVAETIEWTARQPWCDGSIGMAGMSYFAMIQYLAAAAGPSHLKAIFPHQGATDLYRHVAYHGGAAQSDFLAAYSAVHGSLQDLAIGSAAQALLSRLLDRSWSRRLFPQVFPRAFRLATRYRHARPDWLDDYVRLVFDERFDGTFYAERSPRTVLDQIAIPTCVSTNWGSVGLHIFGAFDAWHRIQAPKWLFVGPPESIWPWRSFQEELLAWYDWQLKGIDTGYRELPPVRYWLQGADRWRTADDWPVPGSTVKRWHLAGGRESAGDQRLLDAPPSNADSRSFLAIPRGMPTPAGLERRHATCLRYVTAPFEHDVEIVGPITAQITLASTAPDTFIMVRLGVLHADGCEERKLAFGWLAATHRRIDVERSTPTEVVHAEREPEPLVPGRPTELRLSLTPTANLFRCGQRLVLDVGSRPEELGATFAEGYVFFPWQAPPYPARNTVYHGGEQPSYLDAYVRPA